MNSELAEKGNEGSLAQLGSKILNGNPSHHGEYKYMASLQLNSFHVCSSSLFQRGFLLTTMECACHIGFGIQHKRQKCTAVLGDRNLKNGKIILVSKVAYYKRLGCHKEEIGIVMLPGTVDYTNLQILDLYGKQTDLRILGSDGTLCGWGTVEYDDRKTQVGDAKYSDLLHCMHLTFGSFTICRKIVGPGNYRNKLICGWGKSPKQTTTLGDLGSAVVKSILDDGKRKSYIVGVTIKRHMQNDTLFLRFIRISHKFPDITAIVTHLQVETVENSDRDSSIQDRSEESTGRREIN